VVAPGPPTNAIVVLGDLDEHLVWGDKSALVGHSVKQIPNGGEEGRLTGPIPE
jgi:hypothetical protein